MSKVKVLPAPIYDTEILPAATARRELIYLSDGTIIDSVTMGAVKCFFGHRDGLAPSRM